jgi:hypothetical protein
MRTHNPESLAIVMDKQRDYDGVIRLLIEHNRIVIALKYAAKYEKECCSISKLYQVNYLAGHHAEKLALKLQNERETDDLPSTLAIFDGVLEYLPQIDRVDHFKSAGMHERACEVLIKEGKYEDVYRVYAAQGWHEEGIQQAREQRDRKNEVAFIIFKASTELKNGELAPSTAEMLKKKWGSKSESEAKASLVYGMGICDHKIVWSGYHYYEAQRFSVGCIEALSIALAIAKYDRQSQEWSNISHKNESILSFVSMACKEIKSITDALKALEPNTMQHQIIIQVESFYGLQRMILDDMRYNIPLCSYPWTNELLKDPDLSGGGEDPDGMLQFEVKPFLHSICNRLQAFVDRWIVHDKLGLVGSLHKALSQHPLHEQMLSGGYLAESLLHYGKNLKFQQYFDMLSQAFDTAYYGNTQFMEATEIVEALLNTISPQATCYLPITSLRINSDLLAQSLSQKASQVLELPDEFNFDMWYEAWRISCVTNKVERMEGMLVKHSASHIQVSKPADSERSSQVYRRQVSTHYNLPHEYVLDSTGEYKHLMLLWAKTCQLIRERKIFPSCTVAVHSIIRHIASNKSICTTISISNFLHIITIHTTAILTMYAVCSAHLQYEGNIYIPSSYRNVIEVFQMNSGKQGLDIFRLCIEDVKGRRDLHRFSSKLQNLLTIILKVMIGMHNGAFNPLSYALMNGTCLNNSEALRCLTFVLTLFGNIGLSSGCSDAWLRVYRMKIYSIVKECTDPALRIAYNRFATSATIVGTFGALKRLSESTKDDLTCLNVFIDRTVNKVELTFNQAHLMKISQRRLLPIAVDSTSQESRSTVVMQAPTPVLNPQAKEFHPGSNILASLEKVAKASDPPPEFFSQDSIEPDPEAIAALESTQQPLNPVLPEVNDPMVDKDFCRICACSIQESENESISNHTRTEGHNTNSEIYKHFESEEKDFYIPRRVHLRGLLAEGGALYRDLKDKELGLMVDKIWRELESGDTRLLEIRNSAAWREGVTLLQELCGKLDMLRMKLERMIECSRKKKLDLEKAREEEALKGKEESEEISESDEEEEIEQTDYGEKIRKNKRTKAKGRHRNKK